MKNYIAITGLIILAGLISYSYIVKPNVILVVSNQSFAIDPIDLIVIIDSDTIVYDTLYVNNQHNWKVHKLNLSKGKHSIKAKSLNGGYEITDSFFLFYKKYIYIDYWFYPEDHYNPMPKQIVIEKNNCEQSLM